MSNTVGLVARRGTPPGIVAALNAAANAAIEDPELRRIFLANGAEPVGSTAERYATFVQAERDRFQEVVRATRITVE